MNISPSSNSVDLSPVSVRALEAEESTEIDAETEMVSQQEFLQGAVRQEVARRFDKSVASARHGLEQAALENGARMQSLSSARQAQAAAKPVAPMLEKPADRKASAKDNPGQAARTSHAAAGASPSTMDLDQIGAWLLWRRDVIAGELAQRGAPQEEIARFLHQRNTEMEGSLGLASAMLQDAKPDVEVRQFVNACCDAMQSVPSSPVKLAEFIYAQGGSRDFEKNLQMMRLALGDMQSMGSKKNAWFSYAVANAYILFKSVRDISRKRRKKMALGAISLLADEEESCFALLQPHSATSASLTAAFKPGDLSGRKAALFYDEMEGAVQDLPHSVWEQDTDRRQVLLNEIRERLWAAHASRGSESTEADDLKQRLLQQIRIAQAK